MTGTSRVCRMNDMNLCEIPFKESGDKSESSERSYLLTERNAIKLHE